MLDPRRSAKVAALCGAVVLTAGCAAWFAGSGSTGVETTGAVPREDRPVAALAADVELVAAPQATAICKPAVVSADAARAGAMVYRLEEKLPIPAEDFSLMLRIYWPRDEVLKGDELQLSG